MRNVVIFVVIALLIGCSFLAREKPPVKPVEKPFRVALLVEGSIYDQGWDSQAYLGLKQIERTMHAQVTYIQHCRTDASKRDHTKALAEQGYSIIYGNGRGYEATFNKLGALYPSTHFIFFNGQPVGPNVSSINFTPKSIGYFSGMVAGLLSKTHKIGLIPALNSMEEIEPFIAAAKEQSPANRVFVQQVNDWNDQTKSSEIAHTMIKKGADILVPMGDGYNARVIIEAKNAHILAVGYVSDQSFIAPDTVVTSTIQQVRDVYIEVAKECKAHKLRGGSLYFDFKDGVQKLAPFSPAVSKNDQKKILDRLNKYNEGLFTLPGSVHGKTD
jgi:transcriptional activator of comK gene